MKRRIPVIIDADPGIDDSLALLLAFSNPKKIEVKLLTSAIGNKPIALCTKNSLFLVENFASYKIDVVRGVDEPFDGIKSKQDATDVHGKYGLGNFKAPTPKIKAKKCNVEDAMYKKLIESKEKIVLVAMGPTINFAKLLKKYPDCKDKIECIFIMGASMDGTGNITPYAEFNIYQDPKSFKMILDSGVKTIVSPMHLGRETAIPDEAYLNHRRKTFKEQFIYELMKGSFEPSQPGRFALHDPQVIFGLLEPKLYEFKPCDITVSLKKSTYGQTFITPNPEGNHLVQLAKNNKKISKKMFKAFYK